MIDTSLIIVKKCSYSLKNLYQFINLNTKKKKYKMDNTKFKSIEEFTKDATDQIE